MSDTDWYSKENLERWRALWPDVEHKLEESVELLLSLLSDEEKALAKAAPENRLGLDLGGLILRLKAHLGIRDGNLGSGRLPLSLSCALLSPGDEILLKGVWNSLNGFPLEHHTRKEVECHRCDDCGEQFHVSRWEEEVPVRPTPPLCPHCAWLRSPEYLAREEQTRRENEVYEIRFQNARRLGILIHEGYEAAIDERERARLEARPPDDTVLLGIARELYTSDAQARDLWDAVKGEPPSTTHLPWLRLWKRL